MIQLEISAGVARLRLNRPDKRNALSRELIQQLTTALETVKTDSSVRLLLLSAEGTVFCAGMDLAEMQERAGQPDAAEQWHTDTLIYRRLLHELFTLSIPTVAVAQGPALAGGLGLVLACDLVLASEQAHFSLPEPKRGITAAVVAPLLIHRIGPGAATYLLLAGTEWTASDALRVGLCHEIVAPEQLTARQDELCRSILTGAPAALAKTKQLLLKWNLPSLEQQWNEGTQISAEARETPYAREGLAAFLDKRVPAWWPT